MAMISSERFQTSFDSEALEIKRGPGPPGNVAEWRVRIAPLRTIAAHRPVRLPSAW
jgi:hypothetical protein